MISPDSGDSSVQRLTAPACMAISRRRSRASSERLDRRVPRAFLESIGIAADPLGKYANFVINYLSNFFTL